MQRGDKTFSPETEWPESAVPSELGRRTTLPPHVKLKHGAFIMYPAGIRSASSADELPNPPQTT